MLVTIDDKIRENPELFATVAGANQALEALNDFPPLEITGAWSLAQDPHQRTLVELRPGDSLASLSRR